MSDFFSPRSLATRWGVKVQHVLGMIHRGAIVATDMSATLGAKRPTYRISADEVRRFEAARSVGSATPVARPARQATKRTAKFYA
jgi:hypothetical protein